MKNQYRKFNIKGEDLTPGDDFGMMKEVLTRRFKRLLKEDPDRETRHLARSAADRRRGRAGQRRGRDHARASGSRTSRWSASPRASTAMRARRSSTASAHAPFALRHNDPVLYFVQRLRDEAHRFAIGTHRAKRAKAIGATPLDEVPGVGAARKRALLAHFGSAKAVARANLGDLEGGRGGLGGAGGEDLRLLSRARLRPAGLTFCCISPRHRHLHVAFAPAFPPRCKVPS